MNLARALRIWYKRNFPQWLRGIIYWVVLIFFAIVGDVALLYFLTILTAFNLIDWKTVISFLAVEVLAVVLARMMGIGRESDEEALYRGLRLEELKAAMLPRYAHLEVVCLKGEEEEYPEYPKSQYYIINREKRSAYWVSPLYCSLMQDEIIKHRIFPNVSSLMDYLTELKLKVEPRMAESFELESLPKPEGSSSSSTNSPSV
jgi:hypothetical protein